MSRTAYSAAEIEERAQALYQSRLRAEVEPQHAGEFIVIDPISGDYEVDPDDLTATQRLLTRHPHAVTYAIRIGHPAAYRLGARFVEDEP